MAVTRQNYSDIDDNDCDADSPLNESLLKRYRDNPYSALTDQGTSAPDDYRVRLPERVKTAVTEKLNRLRPDGSNGAEWYATQIIYSRVTNTTPSNGSNLTWETRNNIGHTDDTVKFTVPETGWYSIESSVEIDDSGSGTWGIYEFQVDNNAVVRFDGDDGGEITHTLLRTPVLFHDIIDDFPNNGEDSLVINGTVYLTSGQELKWFCSSNDSGNDEFVGGYFRVREL